MKTKIRTLRTPAGVIYGYEAAIGDSTRSFTAKKSGDVKKAYHAAVVWLQDAKLRSTEHYLGLDLDPEEYPNPLDWRERKELKKFSRLSRNVKKVTAKTFPVMSALYEGEAKGYDFVRRVYSDHEPRRDRQGHFKKNPLNKRERTKILKEARAHDRDSAEHASTYLKAFDKGTAAGMREAVALSRKNPYGELPPDFSERTYRLEEHSRAKLPAGLDPFAPVHNFVEGDRVIRYINRYEGTGGLWDRYSFRKIGHDNPIEYTAHYKRQRLEDPSHFARGSFRTKTLSPSRKLVVGCPSGHYRGGRCSVGMRGQSLLTRLNPVQYHSCGSCKHGYYADKTYHCQKLEFVRAHHGTTLLFRWLNAYGGGNNCYFHSSEDELYTKVGKALRGDRPNPPRKPAFGSKQWQDAKFLSIQERLNRGELLTDEDTDFLNIMDQMYKRHHGASPISGLVDTLKRRQMLSVLSPGSALRRRVSGMPFLNPPAASGGGNQVRPPQGAVLIGQRVKAVEYFDEKKARAEGLENPTMPWRHDYKGGKVYGLKDGSVLIKHPKGKRLWDYR